MSRSPETETHRSFTVRVPLPLYLEIAKLAQDEGTNLNRKVTQLIQLGMGKHISLNAAMRQLLISTITENENV